MELGYLQYLTESNFITIIHTRRKTGNENKRDELPSLKGVLGIIYKVKKVV